MVKRELQLLTGILVMFGAGFVYAWSVLSAPIARDFPNWGQAAMSLTFTLCMSFFCLGGLVSGLLLRRLAPRLILFCSSALFLLGFVLSSAANSRGLLYLGYGLCCGLASGLAYNAVISSVTRQFPGRQGLISGILLMGFGFGSMGIGSLFAWITPETPGAWRFSFVVFGVAIAALMLLGALVIQMPQLQPASAGAALPNLPDTGQPLPVSRDVKPLTMIRRAVFWQFLGWSTLLTASGLSLISQASPLSLVIQPGLVKTTVAFLVGLISICNGFGRIVFGGLYDRVGRKWTMGFVSLFMIGGALLLFLAWLTRAGAILTLGYILAGLAYGGVPTTNSAFTHDQFGATHFPINLSILNLNMILASFSGTLAGALVDRTQSYFSVLVLMLSLAVPGFLLTRVMRDKTQTTTALQR